MNGKIIIKNIISYFFRMNGYHIAFGHLIEGFEVLDQIESLGTIKGYGAQKGETTKQIKIIDCGQL